MKNKSHYYSSVNYYYYYARRGWEGGSKAGGLEKDLSLSIGSHARTLTLPKLCVHTCVHM